VMTSRGVVALAQRAPEEFVEVELLGPGDLDDAVTGGPTMTSANRARDVLGGHGAG